MIHSLPLITVELRQYNHHVDKIKCKKITVRNALLDSGSNVTLIDSKHLQNLKTIKLAHPLGLKNALEFHDANTISQKLECNIVMPNGIELPNRTVLVVSKNLMYPMIIGFDILSGHKLDFTREPFAICNSIIPTKPDSSSATATVIPTSLHEPPGIYCVEEATIPPHGDLYIRCRYKKSTGTDFSGKVHIALETSLIDANLVTVCQHSPTASQMSIQNSGWETVHIPSGALMATFVSEDVDQVQAAEVLSNLLVEKSSLSDADNRAFDADISEWETRRNDLVQRIDITPDIEAKIEDKSIPLQYRTRLKNILLQYNWIFARANNDAGLCKHFAVSLPIKDPNEPPSFRRPYRQEDSMREKLSAYIDEMVSNGILEPTASPWNSPVLCIKKKESGKFRIVNNYAGTVNRRLIPTNYPIVGIRTIMSNISSRIAALKAANPTERIVLSTIDIKSGFYSLALCKSSRDITAFVLNGQQLRYRRLSMGLSTSPSDFQRAVHWAIFNKKFEDKDMFVINFLDDFCVGSTESRHCDAIKEIFQRIRDADLVLGLAKCHFFQKSIPFLGFELSGEGFRIPEQRVAALIAMRNPRTAREAMKYVGSYMFYTRQIPRLSQLLRPIYDGIAMGKSFKFTSVMQIGIDRLKKSIGNGVATPHINYSSDNDNIIFIVVDSSLTGCGFAMGNAVERNGQLTTITVTHYGSKMFPLPVRLLSSRDRELIGASMAILEFEDLLAESLQFTLFVDHKSLETIFSNNSILRSSNKTRVRKALSVLLTYTGLRLQYLSNQDELIEMVDGISRLTFSSGTTIDKTLLPKLVEDSGIMLNSLAAKSNMLEFITQNKPSADRFRQCQQDDPQIAAIYSTIDQRKNKSGYCKRIQYVIRNGILYQIAKNGVNLAICPESLENEILQLLHVQLLHSGSKDLINQVRSERILIRNVSKLAQQIVRFCPFCQFVMYSKFRSQKDVDEPMRPAMTPFATVYCDLLDLSQVPSGAFKFCLTFLDSLTLHLDMVPIRDKTERFGPTNRYHARY